MRAEIQVPIIRSSITVVLGIHGHAALECEAFGYTRKGICNGHMADRYGIVKAKGDDYSIIAAGTIVRFESLPGRRQLSILSLGRGIYLWDASLLGHIYGMRFRE